MNEAISFNSGKLKKIAIMQVVPSLTSGGVERGVIDIAKATKDSGLIPIVVSSGGQMVYELKRFGIKHIKLPVNSKNPITIYINIKRIADAIRENNVDIVHARSRIPAWSCYFACLKTKCRLITTFHGFYSNKLLTKKDSKLKKFYNSIMLKSNAVIAVSNFIKDHIQKTYPQDFTRLEDNLVVIHRGVDINHFSPDQMSQSRVIKITKDWQIPDDKKIIMMPGRLTEWKGHEFLINSLAKVKSKDFFCIMVGSDHGHKSYNKRLGKMIEEKNLSGKIKIFENIRDMAAAYNVCNLVISASIRPEAFGRISIEGGAMKRIVIATKIGGSVETIIDGQTGFLVEPGDTDKMAEKIDLVLNLGEEETGKIINKAREWVVKNFSNQRMFDQTIELYKKINCAEDNKGKLALN